MRPELKNVAWIRTGALGDLLVGLAALAEIPVLFPGAKVTVIGPRLWLQVLSPEAFPFVTEIATVERRESLAQRHAAREGQWRPEGEPVNVTEVLRSQQAVVNLNIDSYRYAIAALAAGVRIRIGTAPAPMAWLYTHCAPFLGKDPLIHERDAALWVLENARAGLGRLFVSTRRTRENLGRGIERSELIRKWRLLGLPRVKSPDLASARALTGCEAKRYVLINPTSSRKTNTWPAPSFHELLRVEGPKLREAGIEPLLIGAPNETEWLKACAPEPTRIVQPSSLQDLADVLAGARGLLTNTSSMQFLAAAMGTPTVTLMGRASPLIWGPVGPRDRAVRGTPPPSLAHDIFAQEQAAYQSIPYAAVAGALQELAGLC